MKIYNRLLCILTISLLVTMSACKDEESIQTEKYSWATSTISPNGTFTIYDFKIGHDGQLYSMGWNGSQRIFSKLIDNNWLAIAQVDETVIVDFTIFNDTIYYSNYHTLKKAKGTTVKTVLDAEFCGLEVYNNTLFFTGTPIQFDGGEYTIMTYDGDKTFTPIDQGIQSTIIKKIDSKLFIGGFPLKIYDGINLTATNYYNGFRNIDNFGSIYSSRTGDNNEIFIRKYIDSNYKDVGNGVKTSAIFDFIEFNSQTTIFSGLDIDKNISETYFLNSKSIWTQIPTTVQINDLISFNDVIFAATNDGQVLELVLD